MADRLENGQLQGIGSCYYSDGSKYQGQWEEGYPQGDGIKTFADGSQRKGKWERGEPKDEPAAVATAPVDPPSPAVVASEPVAEEKEEAHSDNPLGFQ